MTPPREDPDDHAPRPHIEVALEQEILAACMTPRGPDEQREAAFRRIEDQLCALFAQLSPTDARVLRRRLAHPVPDDPIAAQVGRMIEERRERLIAFLADAPRREALARTPR